EDGIRVFHVTGVQTCALPIHPQVVLDVFQHVEHEVVGGGGDAGQRGGVGRLEQHGEVAAARHEGVEVGGDQAAGREGPATGFVRLAQLQYQPVLVHRLVGRVGRIDAAQRAAFAGEVQLVAGERQRAADEVALIARRVVGHRREVH